MTKAKAEPESTATDEGPSRGVVIGVFAVAACVALGYGGFTYGAPGVVLVLAGLALIAVIAAFWSSVRMLIGESRLSGADAYALGTQHTEFEQKRAVLRALKDLEFERAVGKISEEDYRVLVGRFRAEAKALLQVIDEKSKEKRARAEKVVQAHFGQVEEPRAEKKRVEGKRSKKQSTTGDAPSETAEQLPEPDAEAKAPEGDPNERSEDLNERSKDLNERSEAQADQAVSPASTEDAPSKEPTKDE